LQAKHEDGKNQPEMTRGACSPPHSRVSPPSCLQTGLGLSAARMKGRSQGVSYGETADRCKKSKASQQLWAARRLGNSSEDKVETIVEGTDSGFKPVFFPPRAGWAAPSFDRRASWCAGLRGPPSPASA